MKKVTQILKSKFVVLGIIPLILMALIVPNSNLRFQASKAADNCPGDAPQQPAFNVWPLSYTPQDCHDLPMVDARVINGSGRDGRYSQSASEHSAGITAAPGDQIRVAVYFHNGASDQISRNQTTAHNTRVASIANPTSPDTAHNISAAIVADNATAVYSSDPSVGGDFTIHTSTPTTLEYVPGTTIRYNHDGTTVNLPDGAYGGSVNLGDVLACFPYQGYVLYTLKVVGQAAPTNATIKVTKLVRNDSQGGNYSSSTNAKGGETVGFQITVDNTSDVTANNVMLTDQLPSGLAYVMGSASINPQSDLIHYSFGDIPAHGSKTLTLQAKVTVDSGTLTNTAVAKGDNTNQDQSSASVIVSTPPAPGNAVLQITKLVRNASGGLSSFAKNTTANQNDTVEFQITVRNTGTVDAQNVSLNDTLPGELQLSSGQLQTSLGTLSPNASRTVLLQARVNTATAGTYINTATASASNAPTVSETATVTVNQIIINQPGELSITKDVRDQTQGQTAYVTNTNVFNGDRLQYRVRVTNTGQSALTNVVITDTLPSGINFVPGSLGLSMGSGTTPANITVSSLAVNQTVTINFDAVVNATSGSLTNTAQACANSVSCQSASATVNIISNPQPGTITITKLVRNVTQGGSFTTQVSANPGDRIAYQIRVTASNGDVSNVVLTETMPQYLSYVNGTARLNGNSLSDGFINTNTNIGNIANGQTSTVNFEATVSNSVPQCQQTYASNTATVSADNIGTFSSTATVLISGGGSCGGGGYTQLAITKLVRDVNSNHTFGKSDTAAPNDTVEFQITVTNTGTLTVNNLFVNDILPQGLNFISGSVIVDGTNNQGNLFNNNMSLGNLNPGQMRTILFRATVTSSGGATLINRAQAGGSNVSTVQDTATVFVQSVAGANVSLNFAKRAFNDTKNVDATSTPATRDDYITYTLTVTNTGNAPASNFVITDDLANVLNYAGMVDSKGGSMSGNVISYPPVTIPAGGQVTRQFQVRVNYNLPNGSLSLVNTYGNTVVVQIAKPQVAGAVFVAPKTGSTMGYGFMFAGLLTVAFALLKRKGVFAGILAKVPRIRIQ